MGDNYVKCDVPGCRRKLKLFWWNEGTKQSDGWRVISGTTCGPWHTCPIHSLKIDELVKAGE